MKNTLQKTALVACLLGGATLFQNCSKDKQISPGADSTAPLKTAPRTTSLSSVSSQYKVATIYNVSQPARICSASDGTLYFVSTYTHQVFKYTTAGVGSVIATLPNDMSGQTSEGGLKAGQNGTVYGTLMRDNKIYKIDHNKHLSYIPVSVGLNQPNDVAIAPDSTLYIADSQNRRIVKVTKNGTASILAGKTGVGGNADGTGSSARFNRIRSIKFAADGNLWVLDNDTTDQYNFTSTKLRKIAVDGTVTTFFRLTEADASIADFGPAKRDKNFNETSQENFFITKTKLTPGTYDLYNMVSHISDTGVETAITPYSGGFSITDGPADRAQFTGLGGITVKPYGIYVTDYYGAIRTIKKNL